MIAHLAHLLVSSGIATRTIRKMSCHQAAREETIVRSLTFLLKKANPKLLQINKAALGIVNILVAKVLNPKLFKVKVK